MGSHGHTVEPYVSDSQLPVIHDSNQFVSKYNARQCYLSLHFPPSQSRVGLSLLFHINTINS